VTVAQKDHARPADHVNELVAVNVPEPASFGPLGVDRADAERMQARMPAQQLRLAGDLLFRQLVKLK
jgi:hypothetical protein